MESVCFQVHGSFITDTARDFWGEDRYALAMDILEGCGLSKDQACEVIAGKKRLEGVNEFSLEDDSWDPIKDGNWTEDYCDFKTAMKRGENWRELRESHRQTVWQEIHDLYFIEGIGSKEIRARTFQRGVDLIGEEETQQIWDDVMKNYESFNRRTNGLSGSIYSSPIEDVFEATANRLASLGIDAGPLENLMYRGTDKELELDPTMTSKCGWLLPDGRYFACGQYEHIGVAENILQTGGLAIEGMNAEKIAEDRGWIKIAVSAFGADLGVVCSKKPTQKQLNKLFDFCQNHNKDYEKFTNLLDK